MFSVAIQRTGLPRFLFLTRVSGSESRRQGSGVQGSAVQRFTVRCCRHTGVGRYPVIVINREYLPFPFGRFRGSERSVGRVATRPYDKRKIASPRLFLSALTLQRAGRIDPVPPPYTRSDTRAGIQDNFNFNNFRTPPFRHPLPLPYPFSILLLIHGSETKGSRLLVTHAELSTLLA